MEYISLPPGLCTTTTAALACGVQPATVRDWVRRGLLARVGGTPKRPIYRLDDVLAAHAAPKPSSAGRCAQNPA
ncbi:hypothetical protein [Streptomyces manipurensis]|uniref:hypothetical protein n=1 Tax=Streptomyces manipurensis TaxID=1077945 RepID=UPI0005DF66D5|nr:hypothetical protein SF23_18515 [Streptomyces sp. MBRL 10]